jgi:hypothetical protein
MNNVDWGQVGISSAVGGAAGLAGGAAGYGVSNMSFLVNGISSPVLRSAIASPIAAGAGHVASGTAANLFAGQNLGDAFTNSFNGIEKSMIMGGAIGIAATIGTSYANGVSPWTGKSLNNSQGNPIELYRAVSSEELADIQQNGIRVNPDGTGYQHEKLFYKSYEDAVINTRAYDAAYGQKSIIVKLQGPNAPIYNKGYMDGFSVIRINSEYLNLLKLSK